ncbi:MAG: YciI family protein [Planctomycetota bacterium]|jgi:uncharacterized protein YciI
MDEFIYFIHPCREGFISEPTPEEEDLLSRHFAYLKGLAEDGMVVLAGPSLEPPYTGVIIFRAPDREAARTLVDGDPAVAGGVFEARLSAFRISLLGE